MKKTLITLLALAGAAAAADYTYVGSNDDWAEEAENWQNSDGNKLAASGFISANSGALTSGNNFIISNGKSVMAGGNTGGFAGATVTVQSGGTLKIDEPGTVSNANVIVQGTLSVATNKTLGTSTITVEKNGKVTADGNIGAANISVKEGGQLTANGYIGAATITLGKGAGFTTDGDCKLKGTTFNVVETLTLGNIWLDNNGNTGSATFNLGDTGKVSFGTLAYRVGASDNTKWSGTYTLSANCADGYLSGSGELALFERTLCTFNSFTANSGNITTLLDDYFVGAITLNGETLQRSETAFDANALTAENVGQYTFYIDNNKNLKVQYAAYTQSIPEPTTATLSLLALCGLAARRRRK